METGRSSSENRPVGALYRRLVVVILVVVAFGGALQRPGHRRLRVEEAETVLDRVAAADLVLEGSVKPGAVGEHCLERRSASGDRPVRPEHALAEKVSAVAGSRGLDRP